MFEFHREKSLYSYSCACAISPTMGTIAKEKKRTIFAHLKFNKSHGMCVYGLRSVESVQREKLRTTTFALTTTCKIAWKDTLQLRLSLSFLQDFSCRTPIARNQTKLNTATIRYIRIDVVGECAYNIEKIRVMCEFVYGIFIIFIFTEQVQYVVVALFCSYTSATLFGSVYLASCGSVAQCACMVAPRVFFQSFKKFATFLQFYSENNRE